MNNSLVPQTLVNNLNFSIERMGKLQRHLQTGKRVVESSDDPAAISINAKLNMSRLGTENVRANLQSAVSFLQVQEGMLTQVGSILSRMSELHTMQSTQFATNGDRENYNKEFKELQGELQDISRAKFNGISLFSDQMPKTLFGDALDTEIIHPGTHESQSENTMNVTRWGIYRNLSQRLEGGDKRPTGFGEKPEALAFSIVNESLMGNMSPFGTEVDGSIRSYHDHDGDADQVVWDQDNSDWLNYLGSSNVKGKIAVMHSQNAEMAPDKDKAGNYINPSGVVTEGFTESDIELSSNGNFPYLQMKKDGATVADQVTALHQMFDSLTNNKSSLPDILVFNVDNSTSMGFSQINEAILQFKSEIEAFYLSRGKTVLIPGHTSANFSSQIGTNGAAIATGTDGYFNGVRINQGEDYIKQGQEALQDGWQSMPHQQGKPFSAPLTMKRAA